MIFVSVHLIGLHSGVTCIVQRVVVCTRHDCRSLPYSETPSARGLIGSNRSNRLEAGPPCSYVMILTGWTQRMKAKQLQRFTTLSQLCLLPNYT